MTATHLRPGLGLLAAGIAAFVLAACASMTVVTITPGEPEPTEEPEPQPTQPGPVDQPIRFELAAADVPREEAPAASAADVTGVAAGNTAFNADLYGLLGHGEGNLIYSPYSISQAMAMVYGGARGTTETQIADVMHFTLSQEALHPAFNALDGELARAAEQSGQDEAFRLNIANAVWGQTGYPFRQEYLELLARNYGAGLQLLPFASDPEPSRLVINDWVAEQTEDRIQDLLPQGSVTADTRLVLTNAIYFYGAWLYPFEESATADGPFTLLDGSTVTAPFMANSDNFGYRQGDGYQVVVLPYVGGRTAMAILLPDAGQFETVEAGLDAQQMTAILSGIEYTEVQLTMPKFEYRSEYSLPATMKELGMTDPFNPGVADFSGMADTTDELYITEIVHKAFIKVDEAGTEAAAATGVIVGLTSAPVEQVIVAVDRPFIFAIYDQPTGTILFMGRVLNPTE
jgi:serpin B